MDALGAIYRTELTLSYQHHVPKGRQGVIVRLLQWRSHPLPHNLVHQCETLQANEYCCVLLDDLLTIKGRPW